MDSDFTFTGIGIILIIIFVSLFIGTVVSVISYIRYRRHIDRTVAGEEHDLHTKTGDPKTTVLWILAVILGAWGIIALIRISSLGEQIDRLEFELNNRSQEISSKLNGLELLLEDVLYANEEEEEDDDDSEGLDCRFEHGYYDYHVTVIDPGTMTATVMFMMKPYEPDGITEAALMYEGETVPLSLSGGIYEGSINLALFGDHDGFLLKTEKDGSEEIHDLDEMRLYAVGDEVIADFYNTFTDRNPVAKTDGGRTVRISGDLMLANVSYEYQWDGGPEIVNAPEITENYVSVRCGDLEIGKVPFTYQEGSDVLLQLKLKYRFDDQMHIDDLEKDLRIYVVTEYDNGWRTENELSVDYREIFYSASHQAADGNRVLYDADGKILLNRLSY